MTDSGLLHTACWRRLCCVFSPRRCSVCEAQIRHGGGGSEWISRFSAFRGSDEGRMGSERRLCVREWRHVLMACLQFPLQRISDSKRSCSYSHKSRLCQHVRILTIDYNNFARLSAKNKNCLQKHRVLDSPCLKMSE